jgi:hypothetical protein
MSEEQSEGDEIFPWDDVDASRRNATLQGDHRVEDGKSALLHVASACPTCQKSADRLVWFYFDSPDWTWDHLCGRAGWMTICDACRRQVDFFLEILN